MLSNKEITTLKITDIVLDLFIDVERVSRDRILEETYFSTLYGVLEDEERGCVILPRLRNVNLNPLRSLNQLHSFYRVVNNDPRQFIFEYDVISFKNFFQLFSLIVKYPFKTLNLLQKESTEIDIIFNANLMRDISKVGFDVFSRYFFGKNLKKIDNLRKIFSWSEFQDIERSFNLGIRDTGRIKVTACQLLIASPNFLHLPIREIDIFTGCAPHKVLVNGLNALRHCKGIEYDIGVSLRYPNVFKDVTKDIPRASENRILVLGSYDVKATRKVLKQMNFVDKYLFKGHPAIKDSIFADDLGNTGVITKENIYDLFPKSQIIIATAGGTSVEAVSSGLSVIVVGSGDELMNNTLVEKGKGQIWDLVLTESDLNRVYENLLKFRTRYPEKIIDISNWYKNNFFVEPTKKKISSIFLN